MRASLCSFKSMALSVPVSKKKTTCKRSLSIPRFSEDRAIFFIRSVTKLARVKGQIFLKPVLISTRAVLPLLRCKGPFKKCSSVSSHFNPKIVGDDKSSEQISTETVYWVPLKN